VTLEEVTAFYTIRNAGAVRPNPPPSPPAPVTRPRPAADGFVPDAPFVGEADGSYIDPEFSAGASQVVFQDGQNRVWIGDMDPETGMFKTATGRDYLMDENITIIFDRPPQGRKFSTNGPEWTRDAKGHGVVYTKADEDGVMQQWMARLVDGKSVVTQLTHNKRDSYGNMPSRFQDGKPPRIAYTYDWPIWKAKAAWIFADKPDEPHDLDGFDYNQMSMWSAVSPDFLFVKRTDGAPHGQIARANADTGKVTVLTNDDGQKNDPGLFLAPEFGGEMLLVCNVDNRALGIYRDLKSPDGFWTRIATLALPADAPYKFISSVETIAAESGVGGVSYFSLLARENKDRNTAGSIWVLGLCSDEKNRFARRVDDGAVTGEQSVVLEPEPFVGTNEVFVYYNSFSRASGKHGLRRAVTGIKVIPAAVVKPASDNARYLVLISIDACRPDYFTFADVPNIKALMSAGVTYDGAWVGHLRNDTPPGHVTMATGAFPRNHQVIGFHWRDPATGKQFKPTTWFGVAKGQLNEFIAKSGCVSIGSLYKKEFPGSKVAALSSDKFYAAAALGADSADFIGYCRYEPPKGFGTAVGLSLSPVTVTGRQVPAAILNDPSLKQKVTNPWDGDSWTVDFALRLFAKEKPEILLLNLALCDDIGHTHGANLGKEPMAGIIANVDRQLGRLMEAYRQAGILDKTIIVVTSDHGMSANFRTIDETPTAQVVSEYGMQRSAARLEFYVKEPAKAKEAADKIAHLKLAGIHAVYYKEKDGERGFRYVPAPGSTLSPDLDACYRYLTSTYASAQSADLVCFSDEHWNIRESMSYFKGDHGTVTWENQHIPLIIAGPGIKKGLTSHAPARLVDIAPTVLAGMGLKPEKMDGVVLADALVSPADALIGAQQAVNAQLNPLQAALKQRHDQDVAAQAGTKPEPSRPAGQPRRTDRNERRPIAGESGAPAAGGAAQYFKQLDRNGDGKVSREEAGNAPWFERLDRNKDGFITTDELPASPAPQQPAAAMRKPGTVSQESAQKRSFKFTRDYKPGTKDASGKMRTGQELMRITAYQGQLYAGTSTFTDPRLYTDDPDYTGCQVLRKLSSQSEWQVDASFGKRYLRTDCLEVIRFTQDANGKPLPQPVEMLVAGIWDNGSLDGRRERFITIATHNDTPGEWTLSQGPRIPVTERGFASVRAMKLHRDRVTGREYLFVGAACGGLYKVVYDPSAPGRVRWVESDELDKSYGRIHSMCICNGSLYVSADYGGLTVQSQSGGVFRRIDGTKPTWERIYRNYDPKYPTWNQTGRGITAVPAEDGSGKEVILIGIEDPPEAVIVRIEPHHDHKAAVELNYRDYCRDAIFGREFPKIGGSAQYPAAGADIAAVNYFEPFIEPETGKTNHFVTLIIAHPDDPAEGCNNAYFLIRRAPGAYDWGEIPSGLPLGENLRGTRTVAKSPFPDEPDVYYFGGFFGGPDVQPARPNLAWIYKGVVGVREHGTVKSSPLPPRVPLVTFESAEQGFSFSYPQNLVKTENTNPLLLVQANNREAPSVLSDAVAANSVKEAVTQSFNKTFATRELERYTERNEYFAGRKGIAGNIGGRVVTGKRFTFEYSPGSGQPAVSAVGVGWSKGNTTQIIVVSYWGAYTEAMANYQLNKILATLTIK
jgi:predicted AlkP superfamily pyrophosphatase or phosphodiesterase